MKTQTLYTMSLLKIGARNKFKDFRVTKREKVVQNTKKWEICKCKFTGANDIKIIAENPIQARALAWEIAIRELGMTPCRAIR